MRSCGLGAVPQVEGGHCKEGGGSALEQGHRSQGSRAEFITTGIPLPLGRQKCGWIDRIGLCHGQRWISSFDIQDSLKGRDVPQGS